MFQSLIKTWIPVSKKEIDRNNAIYAIQHNRNPYIDYPALAEYIWGDKQNETFSLITALDDKLYTPILYYSHSKVIIEDFSSEGTISLYDLQGRLIKKEQLYNGLNQIAVDVNQTFIAIINSNKGSFSKKLTPIQ